MRDKTTGGGGGPGGQVNPLSPHFNSRTKKGPNISVTDVQNLYGPKVSKFLLCMLQFLDNICRLFIFSNYMGK